MTGATSPQATTSTPESSEAPRENRAGAKRAWFDENPELKQEHVDYLLSTKVSSPELASLAAKYVGMDRDGYVEAVTGNKAHFDAFIADVRALAASVLAQAEPSK